LQTEYIRIRIRYNVLMIFSAISSSLDVTSQNTELLLLSDPTWGGGGGSVFRQGKRTSQNMLAILLLWCVYVMCHISPCRVWWPNCCWRVQDFVSIWAQCVWHV